MSSREPERRAGLAAVAVFAFLTVYFTGSFPPFANPNELSRLETVYAFVELGTFQIDRAIPAVQNRGNEAEARLGELQTRIAAIKVNTFAQ